MAGGLSLLYRICETARFPAAAPLRQVLSTKYRGSTMAVAVPDQEGKIGRGQAERGLAEGLTWHCVQRMAIGEGGQLRGWVDGYWAARGQLGRESPEMSSREAEFSPDKQHVARAGAGCGG